MNQYSEVRTFLHAQLQLAKQNNNWNRFPNLVHILVQLDNLGFKLCDRESRYDSKSQFEIRDRVIVLKPGYVDETRNVINRLSPDVENQPTIERVQERLGVLQDFNDHQLYFPDSREKVKMIELKDLALEHGVHSHLARYRESEDSRILDIARRNCVLTGRNFEKEVGRYFNMTPRDVQNLFGV